MSGNSQWLFDWLDAEFKFDLIPVLHHNTKCKQFFTKRITDCSKTGRATSLYL